MEKMNTTEKTSNKKTFSKEPIHNTSEFQIENMKHKIKTVKKKRKLYNYKNIEQLKNIHDDVVVDHSTNTVIEGLPKSPIAKFREDEYEGGKDDIYEREEPAPTKDEEDEDEDEGDSESMKSKWTRFKASFANIDTFGDEVVETLIRSFSIEKVYEKDKKMIKGYITGFFSILIAFFLTANLCVMMFLRIDGKRLGFVEYDPYADKDEATKNSADGYPIFYRYTEQYMRRMLSPPEGVAPRPEFEILYFFLSVPLALSELFGSFLESSPEFLTNYFNLNALYLLVFGVMFSSVFFLPKLVKHIVQNASNPTKMGVGYGSLALFITISYISMIYKYISVSSDRRIGKRFDSLSQSTPAMVVWFLVAVLQLLFFIFMGPPLATLLFVGLFLFVTCFSLLFYSNYNFGDAFDLFDKLHKMAVSEMTDYEIPADNNCRKTGFMDDFKYYLHRIFHFGYKNLHTLSFVILFGIASLDYHKHMRSERLKNMLIPFTVALMVGFATMMDNPFHYIFQTADSP
jgi:hypothetical protein